MPLLSVDDRSPEVQAAAQKFEMSDLTNPDARQVASSFARLAQEIIYRIRGDDKEGLLADALEALHNARTHAISAILPAVRRPQFEGREAAKSLPQPPPDEDEEDEEEPIAPRQTARATTARSKTARNRASASR